MEAGGWPPLTQGAGQKEGHVFPEDERATGPSQRGTHTSLHHWLSCLPALLSLRNFVGLALGLIPRSGR